MTVEKQVRRKCNSRNIEDNCGNAEFGMFAEHLEDPELDLVRGGISYFSEAYAYSRARAFLYRIQVVSVVLLLLAITIMISCPLR